VAHLSADKDGLEDDDNMDVEPKIWKHFGGTCRAWTCDRKQIRKLRRMSKVEPRAQYFGPGSFYAEDFDFPVERYDAVARVLGLETEAKKEAQ
jgi:hypothetical protein